MKIKNALTEYHFPEEVIDILSQFGMTDFYPPQTSAIKIGCLKGENLLMSVPTAAGKTLIAELCMLKSIVHNNGRCLYIVPLKALASEKYEDFKKKYARLKIKVGLATGDFDAPNKFLNRFQILIATAEKVDSLLRTRAQWLIQSLSVVVLDEIHFINDGTRGPTLEILTARIKQFNPKAQILALSATVKNAKEMADWLKAKLVLSDWRPIPLREGVYFNEVIKFNQGPARLVKEEPDDDLSKLTLDTLRGKGQVLIFVNSRRSAQATSRQICKSVTLTLSEDEKKELAMLSKTISGAHSSSTKMCRKLAEVIRLGCAFHHAGLKPKQRKLIEDHFKKNLIKVICSTPTLAAGVNLPARRAIIRDCKRFEEGLGASYIPTSEYKQCAGRAGRPQYDQYGEAVLMAKSLSELSALFDRYINADPEPVISKLGNESALRMHVLASIAGGYVHDVNSMFEFIAHTFLAHQKRINNLIELISHIFGFLQSEGFIEKSGFSYYATAFGQSTSRLYIDPMSSITLRDGLKKITAGKSFSSIGLLHLICCCPDHPLLNVNQKDFEDLEMFTANYRDELILSQKDLPILEDFFAQASIMKTTWMLSQWTEEEKEEVICDQFGIGPGDIYRHTEATQWLLHAASVFAELFQMKKLTFVLENLRQRVEYGIKEELLELTQLKGIGRIRARNLFSSNFKKISDLKYSSVDKLSQVNQIGKTLAKDILSQINNHSSKKLTISLEDDLLESL